MAPVVGHRIGKEVAEALGLESVADIRSIRIDIAVDDVVTAEVEYMPSESQVKNLVKILRRYELHEVGEPARVEGRQFPEFEKKEF